MIEPVLPFAGRTYRPELDGIRLTDQALRVFMVMSDGQWRTLAEISTLADAPEASVSARLRDLRKPEFGAYPVARRRRGEASAGLWEYQLTPTPSESVKPTTVAAAAAKKSGFLRGLMFAANLAARASDLPALKAQLRDELVKAFKR